MTTLSPIRFAGRTEVSNKDLKAQEGQKMVLTTSLLNPEKTGYNSTYEVVTLKSVSPHKGRELEGRKVQKKYARKDDPLPKTDRVDIVAVTKADGKKIEFFNGDFWVEQDRSRDLSYRTNIINGYGEFYETMDETMSRIQKLSTIEEFAEETTDQTSQLRVENRGLKAKLSTYQEMLKLLGSGLDAGVEKASTIFTGLLQQVGALSQAVDTLQASKKD